MKLKRKHTMVYGKKREGKSNWVQWAVGEFPGSVLIYDTCREHETAEADRYLPEHRKGDEADAELAGVIERVITENDRDRRPDLFVIEEISRFKATDELFDLIDLNAHYDVGILGVARRPAQVDTDAVELADQSVVFYLGGDNDQKKLNAMESGLGDRTQDLDKYHYLVNRGREIEEHPPVPEMDTTGEL